MVASSAPSRPRLLSFVVDGRMVQGHRKIRKQQVTYHPVIFYYLIFYKIRFCADFRGKQPPNERERDTLNVYGSAREEAQLEILMLQKEANERGRGW